MTFERLLPGVVGALIGLCGALLLSVVARWREDERSRSEARVVLRILIAEIEHRYGILNNKYAEVDFSDDIILGDMAKHINWNKSGPTFNYAEELRPYQAGFEALKDRLGTLGADAVVGVWRHYTTMEEMLLAHNNELQKMSGDRKRAPEILSGIRSDTKALIGALGSQLGEKSSRAFLIWLPLWIVGKS